MGAQVATALLAVGLSAYFAQGRSLELVENSLRVRLDAVAEEVESRAEFAAPLDPDAVGLGADGAAGTLALPRRLRLDLATRFPDPVALLDAEGAVLDDLAEPARDLQVPEGALQALAEGRIGLRTDGAGWALAPLLDVDGVPVGGLLVRPLTATLDQELAGTRGAYWRAVAVTLALAVLLALALGGLLTLGLVRPLRRITRRVESLGAGDYAARLPARSRTELGRLAAAINEMAAQVEASFSALRQADRLRRDLVANVGHDLRTPLAALKGYLDEAERLEGAGRLDEAAQALETARAQADGMARLVDDLFELSVLDAAALEAGAAPLRRAPVPLGELAADAARAHRAAFERAGVALKTAIAPGLPTVEADAARLLRVLDNLLRNALRHTPAGGVVTLEAEPRPGGGGAITVRDTGPGLDPHQAERVFERYYQGGDARTRGSGTGLGLAIARAIAEAHGGTLTLASTPGEGAAFTLGLPADPTP